MTSSTVPSRQAFRLSPALRAFLHRAGSSLGILLIIAYLTLFGLIVGERGKAGLPARALDAGLEALRRTLDYLVHHPLTYYWQRQDLPAADLVLTLFARSAALLLLSLAVAALAGVWLGVRVTLSRRERVAPLVLLLSVLGISTPTFLLGMLFWVINVQVYRWAGLSSALLPPTGFGWDAHLVMPVLVLAMRPLAQIVQITHVSLSNVLAEDYVRTAHAKGLRPRLVVNRHALRNIMIPVLTTLGMSLRFSLASLPVVETFFNWPGVGAALLQAIELGLTPLVADLIVVLGFLFLLINLALDVIYRVVDPRLRAKQVPHSAAGLVPQPSGKRHTWRSLVGDWRERWEEASAYLSSLLSQARRDIARLARLRPAALWNNPGPGSHLRGWLHGLRRGRAGPHAAPANPGNPAFELPMHGQRSSGWLLRRTAGNLPLLVGGLMVLGLAAVAVFGGEWAAASPYETHRIMTIEGKVGAPPFPPSPAFPWGSDAVGRDIQALVLAGAKQTLMLALLAMLARVSLGTLLGVLAGWWQGGWLDRLVNAAVAVWAAFPVTLFAMIVVLALGIQQGVSVFVVALCVVGWGEIAQFMRGQVIGLKPQSYIEAAQAVGARVGRLLTRHMLPHLWAPLLVLAALEMSSVLLLLAELGFLNVFLGGGFKAAIAETGRMQPVIYYFSDVPEWGALLANIRGWWRSYPWLAWYPGVAFFIAILAFNLWGEGLRRLLDDSRVNIAQLINRYTLAALGLTLVGGAWLLHSSAPVQMYREQAQQFDVQRAMQHVRRLAAPEMQGRESGTPGAQAVADYIAAQMKEMGLLPAGEKETYFYTMIAPRAHLAGVPRLEILDAAGGQAAQTLAYRQDFVEFTGYHLWQTAQGEGEVVGLAVGPPVREGASISLHWLDLEGKVLVLREADLARLNGEGAKMAGMLLVSDDPGLLERRSLYVAPDYLYHFYFDTPILTITPQAAEQLLAPPHPGTGTGPGQPGLPASAGGSLASLDAQAADLAPGQLALTEPGRRVRMAVPVTPENPDETHQYVIGYIPGTGALMGEEERGEQVGLDSKVVVVSAYFDGLGIGPEGSLYPGANDNASGVAAMLEIARVLKASPNPPRKTVVFIAWSGAERREGLSLAYAMNAKPGFNLLSVENVIELSGVGAGGGKGIALGQGTSFSLVQLFQDAARRVGVPVTTRGRGPHHGLEARSGFGGRSALSAYVSWNGSDRTAHTPADTPEAIDPAKLEAVGQTTLLVASVLGQAAAQEPPMRPLLAPDEYVQGARMFDEAQALRHIQALADDAMEGRRPGTPGGRAAGEYIAARFAEYGLEPAGPDGSYFQPFTAPYTTVVESPLLSMAFPGGPGQAPFTRTYTYHADYMPRTQVIGSGQAEGQVIWLDDCMPGDFAGQDVAGKIILCYADTLDEPEGMFERVLASGASGLLVMDSDLISPLPRPTYGGGELFPMPTFYVTQAIAQDLVAPPRPGTGTGPGQPGLPRTQHTLHSLRSTTAPLSATVRMAARIEVLPVEARNVLGLLPGADPDHRDEIVVIGAYYDGLGRDPDGTIYNGAYANASGVAAVLEIARLWQAQDYRPARSVLFAAWDDSEQGWWGARHYVRHPSCPLDRTVAMLNLNMAGRGRDVLVVGREAVAAQFEASARVYSATVEFIPPLEWGDSLAFHEGAVPTAILMVVEPSLVGSVYHQPEDDAENIQLESLRAAGVLAAHSLAAWSGGGPTRPLPDAGPPRTLRDLVLPTPTCVPPWPVGSMTCDHGQWAR